jgi:hypothetical protein
VLSDAMSDESFVCGTCGQEHPGLPSDYAYGLPDDVYSLGYLERYKRSRSNADLCTLDEERFFVRGVLPIPFVSSDKEFVWGLWVEVSEEQHNLYLDGYYDDLSDNPRFEARLANTIPGYIESSGLIVDVQFRSGNDRPTFHFSSNASHLLAREQRYGITQEQHHQILEKVGVFDQRESA